MKQIALALHEYHDHHGHLPPVVVKGQDGRPLYSWRVLVLPYLEANDLYAQFRLEEAWDGPHNQSLLARMPKVFAPPPVDDLEVEPYTTFYQAIVGGGTAFEGGKELKLSDFRDGTANTLLVVEARQAVPWTKPADVPYAVNRPVPQLGGIFHSKGRFSLFGANRQVGFGAVFADGSVRFLRADLPEATLRGLITRNGGEKLGDDW